MGEHRFKYRKFPTVEYPRTAPKLPSNLEVLYHAVIDQRVEDFIRPIRNQLVTSHLFYRPAIFAVARVVFQGTRWEIHLERQVTRIIEFPNGFMIGDWDKNLVESWDHKNLRSSPADVCSFRYDRSYDFSSSRFDGLQEEFIQYLLSHETLELIYNPNLKIHREFEESEESFHNRCLEKVHENYRHELKTLQETISRREGRLKERLERTLRDREASEDDLPPLDAEVAKMQEQVTIRETTAQIQELETLKAKEVSELETNLVNLSRQQEKDIVRLNRGDIDVLRFTLIWLPYCELIIQEDEVRRVELIPSF